MGIMLAEHDARPHIKKIIMCHRSESKHTTYLFCLCAITNGGEVVGIIDGYIPAKDIIPKNPYRVFLQYQLVKNKKIPTDTEPKY
jgi:hypothetical protein